MASRQCESVTGWLSSPEYRSQLIELSLVKFQEVTDLLLERPNLNSTHLFRADIVSDSAANLQTIFERENSYKAEHDEDTATPTDSNSNIVYPETSGPGTLDAPDVEGYQLDRTVVRILIPRKPQVDRPLKQSCFIYSPASPLPEASSLFVVYVPHVDSEDQIPWYHPQVKALAYQYEHDATGDHVSIHYQLFSNSSACQSSDRLHRTFLSLLQTLIRLSKFNSTRNEQASTGDGPSDASRLPSNPLRDAILPQHRVQDTYTRLKKTYASDLISRWVEKTEPSKHVFEDLSIAAFLIELWKTMYHNKPAPKFIDIACGNGVLVYILIKEGFTGSGFDARRRKTWDVIDIDQHLHEALCIPKPFLDALGADEVAAFLPDIAVHDGIFDEGTFIISNHADELTLWTPLLGTLSNPDRPLPFLAIPCCSHALNGARHRYSLKDLRTSSPNDTQNDDDDDDGNSDEGETEQPSSGSLKTLRGQQAWSRSHADDKSSYACLTKKAVALAAAVGVKTEMTLMRIPSTRNIGVVGGWYQDRLEDETRKAKVMDVVERECAGSGGVVGAARVWVDSARKIIEGKGRGKVNLKKQRTVPIVQEVHVNLEQNTVDESKLSTVIE